MEYEKDEKKPGRKEFKQDVEESVSKAIKKNKKKPKKKKNKYDDLSSKEMYQMVKQKRDAILQKRGIPAKIPRGKKALILICKRIKA